MIKKAEDGTSLHVDVTSNAKKQIKKKKVKNDFSEDNSSSVIGDNNSVNNDNSKTYNINYNLDQVMPSTSSQLSVKARWLNFIPYRLEKKRTGIDDFNVLVPIENDYIEPCIEIHFEGSTNKKTAFYLRFAANISVYNIKLKTIEFNGVFLDINKSLFGVLDETKAAVIMGDKWGVTKANVKFHFHFEYEKESYIQVFEFTSTEGRNWFNSPRYYAPESEINWEIRQHARSILQARQKNISED